jgi:hypothetical protein
MRLPIPLAGNHGIARSSLESNQITINLYPEITKDGKSPVPLYRVPGVVSSVELGTGICRSHGALFLDKIFFVSGSKLYSIDVNETVTEIGTLNTTAGRVSIIEGQTYLMLVDGSDGYTYDGTTFAAISDVGFPTKQTPALTVHHVTYKDGFFCVTVEDTGDFYISALENPTSWDALDFENAEGRPDLLKTLHASDDFLYLFGDYSTEAHYNNGSKVFPFARAQGGVSSWGIHAEWSTAEGDNAVFYLGQIREGGIQIIKTVGSRVEVISTPEIADEISKLSLTTDAFGFCYMQNSHHFYVLTFPTAKKTFVFDITTGLWHTRKTKDIDRWRPNGHGYFNSKHYVGSHEDGQFYTLDLATYTDNSEYIECNRTTAPIHKNYASLTYHELVLDLEGGTGDLTSEPTIMMRYSDDGGKTWSNEIQADIGLTGNYKYKAYWDQLGDAYERIFEFRTTDSFFTTWLGCYARVTESAF